MLFPQAKSGWRGHLKPSEQSSEYQQWLTNTQMHDKYRKEHRHNFNRDATITKIRDKGPQHARREQRAVDPTTHRTITVPIKAHDASSIEKEVAEAVNRRWQFLRPMFNGAGANPIRSRWAPSRAPTPRPESPGNPTKDDSQKLIGTHIGQGSRIPYDVDFRHVSTFRTLNGG